MSVFGITTNYGFNLINFAGQTWHQDEYENWRKLDSLLTGIASNTPFASDTGAADAYVVTYTPAIVAYTSGMVIAFKPGNNNTGGAVTINVNGLGTKSVKIQNANVPANTIVANGYVKLSYNGVSFELIEPKVVAVVIADGSIAPAKLTTGAMTWNASGDITAGRDLIASRNAVVTSDVKSATNQIFFRQASNTFTSAAITYSTSAPSGGNDGDLWFTYT